MYINYNYFETNSNGYLAEQVTKPSCSFMVATTKINYHKKKDIFQL